MPPKLECRQNDIFEGAEQLPELALYAPSSNEFGMDEVSET
jgi:hypothetical protein